MAIEIERKFLVHVGKLPDMGIGAKIAQGYLCYKPTVRVRVRGGKAYITVKGEGLVSRDEVESTMEYPKALNMLAMCDATVRKTRYIMMAMPLRKEQRVWEVDIFEGHLAGLVMAEIELGSEDEVFDRPDWLGEEVTYDPRFTNSNLARAKSVPVFTRQPS
jgi:adenylate cyclase